MLLADLEGCDNRVQKLQAAVAKPTQEHDEQKQELDVLLRCREALENERPLREVVQPGDEEKLLRSFGFLTQKPVILVINVGEQDIGREPAFRDEQAAATFALCAELEAELIQMDRADRPEFMAEWGIPALARDRIIRACFDALGMISFFTFVHDEVRAWAIPGGTTAVEAAGKIHTDIARGFIRAETVAFDALKAAGSLKEAKSAGHIRQEHKHYVVQDGDVITVKFHV
jgi:ribosome-binding ATPase YchF (GTP1/OBG family)